MRLVNGAPILFTVTPAKPLKSLTGTWLGHEVFFSFDATTKSWFGFAGVALETKPGSYPLELSAETSTGKKLSFSKKFAVRHAKYPEVKLTVAAQYTAPSPEQLKKIEEDKELKKDILSRTTPEREWAGKFSPPADAAISDVFGTQRIFNGQVQSSHLGLDFRVPSGTSVAAMNSGTVLLARPLYFEGNCVVLDHGQGLLSIYMHLSEFKVKEGERVARGQELALSGGTGRATGPHLHVAVRWQGIYLDPATLLSLKMP